MRGATMKGPFEPDQRSDNEGARHPADDNQVVVAHGCSLTGSAVLYQFSRGESRAIIGVGVGAATAA